MTHREPYFPPWTPHADKALPLSYVQVEHYPRKTRFFIYLSCLAGCSGFWFGVGYAARAIVGAY